MHEMMFERTNNASGLLVVNWGLFLFSVKFRLKVSGPRVQTFCIEKDLHMDAI